MQPGLRAKSAVPLTQKVMAQTTEQQTIYKRDFNLWLIQTISHLRAGRFDGVDLEHLVEELEGLANRDRREVSSRLRVLLAHLLKRLYVPNPYDYRGWDATIREQRRQLEEILEHSPSLRDYFIEIFDQAWDRALSDTRREYPQVTFPDHWQFSRDVNDILSEEFWQ